MLIEFFLQHKTMYMVFLISSRTVIHTQESKMISFHLIFAHLIVKSKRFLICLFKLPWDTISPLIRNCCNNASSSFSITIESKSLFHWVTIVLKFTGAKVPCCKTSQRLVFLIIKESWEPVWKGLVSLSSILHYSLARIFIFLEVKSRVRKFKPIISHTHFIWFSTLSQKICKSFCFIESLYQGDIQVAENRKPSITAALAKPSFWSLLFNYKNPGLIHFILFGHPEFLTEVFIHPQVWSDISSKPEGSKRYSTLKVCWDYF